VTLAVNLQLTGALEQAAQKSRTAVEAKEYLDHPPTDGRYGVEVNWTWGARHEDGYLSIKYLVTRMIEKQMYDLIRQAVREIQQEAQDARHIASDLMSHLDR
jgi:hypothetical protein